MNIQVIFINPNPSGSHIVYFDQVLDFRTDKGELHVFTSDGKHPDAVFAAKQWVSVQRTDIGVPSASTPPTGSATGQLLARTPRQRPSDLSDLAFPTPIAVEQARAASVQFAIDNLKIPWSEAHMRAVLDYEKLVANEYGIEAVRDLPWNRVPRGNEP